MSIFCHFPEKRNAKPAFILKKNSKTQKLKIRENRKFSLSLSLSLSILSPLFSSLYLLCSMMKNN